VLDTLKKLDWDSKHQRKPLMAITSIKNAHSQEMSQLEEKLLSKDIS
jgi:hypothetical protein